MAWRQGSPPASTFQANKRVTFESDGNTISNHIGRKSYAEPWNHFRSSSAASVTSHSLTGGAAAAAATSPPLTSTPTFTSAISSTTGVTSASPGGGVTTTATTTHVPFSSSSSGMSPSTMNTKYTSKSLAMKILCEKILDGYTMTRNHCPKCSIALLRSNNNASGSMLLNNNDAAQCVFCPIVTLRNNISKSVGKRVLEAKFSSGVDFGAVSGQKPCESCSSPTLLDSQGAAMECSVCPVLDAACIAISREQERGAVFSDSQCCIECGSQEMTRGNGLIQCVVCDTLRMRLGELQPIDPVYHESIPAIKSNDPPLANVNLAKLQEELQDELAKAALSQKSLMMRFQPMDKADESTNREHEVEESLTILENSSVDFMKLQKQLRTVKQNSSAASGLSKFQDQLRAELAKTKEAQASMMLSLHDSRCSSSFKSRDELEAELNNAKQHQVTLEKIIEGTNIIENATSNDPEFAGGLTDLLATIAPGNLSYSISQQEVDATGNVKEYIPPPTFFRHNIPKEVIVYHIPEEHECDPSVAEKSHHTHNLKQTERYPQVAQNSSMFDCCGSSPETSGKREENALQDEDNYDYDTIETDDDYTVDNTLNTIDNGRLEYLRAMDESRLGYDNNMRSSHSRASGSIASVQNDKYQYNMDNNMTPENGNHNTTPSASSGRCFFMCFNCGGEDDVCSTVGSSKREYIMQHDQDDHRRYPARNGYSMDSYNVRDDESVQLVRSPSPFSYTDSVNNGSEFGSMNRMSHQRMKSHPKSSLRYSDPPTDHNSVQSDLTDHSNVIRRVTFGTSCRPGKWERNELRALTEESDGEVNDKYSLGSVEGALSNNRIDWKRMY